ncbi:MAG: transcriptional repressor [Coriobacteriia bacterium]|nr:transcriptional repressor [Coriobacteriia bacterium]
MSVADTEVARRVEELATSLRGAGFRLTHQRLEVVREVASAETHPDAEVVFTAVRERVPTISLDTVYRTLGTLVDLGLVNRVAGTTATARYDANTTRHHHFVCARCGLIRDVESPVLDEVGVPDHAADLGRVSGVEVRFSGVCRRCIEAESA